jgi:hypothetical protein
MAQQAEAVLEREHGLPLGLIIIDTIAACAGYRRSGEDNDNAVSQAVMDILKAVAQKMGCYVLGVAHFGKDQEAGTIGGVAKENSADNVFVCLGHKELSGALTNTRLAVRKNRGGPQGQEFPFSLRLVEMGLDEDGEPETTMVVDWLPPGAAAQQAPIPPDDPWVKGCRQQEQRTAMVRLKRVLLEALAERGVDRPIPDALQRRTSGLIETPEVRQGVASDPTEHGDDPDATGRRNSGVSIGDELRQGVASDPVVRMVDQETVEEAFYQCTPNDPRQTQRSRFVRARDRAEQLGLIAAGNIEGVTYLWLTHPEPEDE